MRDDALIAAGNRISLQKDQQQLWDSRINPIYSLAEYISRIVVSKDAPSKLFKVLAELIPQAEIKAL